MIKLTGLSGLLLTVLGCAAPMPAGPSEGDLPPAVGSPVMMLGLERSGFDVNMEDSQGDAALIRVEIHSTEEGWTQTMPWAQLELVRQADGSIAKVGQIDLIEGVHVFFEPPLPVLPIAIAEAQALTHRATGDMRVHRIGSEAGHPLARGNWTLTIERGADSQHAGHRRARLDSTFEADLGLSSVSGVATEVLDLAQGPMYWQQQVRRTLLGIPSESWRRWRRADTPSQ
ncbi:MAG: hypothetical protein MK101_10870 [Phycisphaerales bacterium]|nr:hypothetical protein [Phycisphaerales bacterium]